MRKLPVKRRILRLLKPTAGEKRSAQTDTILSLMIQTEHEFASLAFHFQTLSDSDPQRAIDEARATKGRGEYKTAIRALRAGILIDAGQTVRDEAAVREGVSVFRQLASTHPKVSGFRYNLANGLSGLSRLRLPPKPPAHPDWYAATQVDRREARCIYQEVAKNTEEAKLAAQALTNLGNELDQGFRWVEAYDSWVEALNADPANQVAALSTARMLLRRTKQFPSHPPSLHRVAGYYCRLATRGAGSIEQIAGAGAARMARSLPTFRSRWRPRKLSEIKDPFGKFVARQRLALVGTIEGLDLRKARWDDVYIGGVSEKFDSGPGVPPVFATINQLKADYCAARWALYTAESGSLKETSVYGDTLDYAVYGLKPSLLILAQRSSLDVLDRVAVCANEHFRIGDNPQQIWFRGFWRQNSGTGPWRSVWKEELDAWNPGLIALGDLASDLAQGGLLWDKHLLRNAGTHRFCVLHDLGKTPSRISPAVDHHGRREFLLEAVLSLRIARSAILYLIDAIAWRERRIAANDSRLALEVYPHHYIRGEGSARW
jgi:hypothetical protein